MMSFPNIDTFNTLLSTDSFNTIGSAKLYGPDNRVGCMAPTSAESFPAFVSLGICARACVLCTEPGKSCQVLCVLHCGGRCKVQ